MMVLLLTVLRILLKYCERLGFSGISSLGQVELSFLLSNHPSCEKRLIYTNYRIGFYSHCNLI